MTTNTPENSENNPMGTDLTKPDVDKLTEDVARAIWDSLGDEYTFDDAKATAKVVLAAVDKSLSVETNALLTKVADQAAEIENLKDHLADSRLRAADFRSECIDKTAEIERLRKALHFYGDEHQWPDDGPWGANSDDYGDVAREALKGEA